MASTDGSSKFRHSLSDIDIGRIKVLTQNIDILGKAGLMVDRKQDIDTTDEGGVTLFYSAIQNMEWNVAEYLLDIGADAKLVPPKDEHTFTDVRLSDLDEISGHIELRMRWLVRLIKLGVLDDGDKEFVKRLLFVGRYASKDVVESVIKILPENVVSCVVGFFEMCCNNDFTDVFRMLIKKGRKVELTEFDYALYRGRLDFFKMLCNEDIESFGKLDRISESFRFWVKLIVPIISEEKIDFIFDFMKSHNLEGCCRALFRAAAQIWMF